MVDSADSSDPAHCRMASGGRSCEQARRQGMSRSPARSWTGRRLARRSPRGGACPRQVHLRGCALSLLLGPQSACCTPAQLYPDSCLLSVCTTCCRPVAGLMHCHAALEPALTRYCRRRCPRCISRRCSSTSDILHDASLPAAGPADCPLLCACCLRQGTAAAPLLGAA